MSPLTQFITKARRAFERAPTKASSFTRKSESVLLKRQEDAEWEEGLQVIVDAERLDMVLGNCARALYFHETSRKFVGPIRVVTAFTMYKDAQVQDRVTSGLATTESFFANHEQKGENPDVFWYKFAEGDNSAIFLMCFYSHSEVIVKLYKCGQPA